MGNCAKYWFAIIFCLCISDGLSSECDLLPVEKNRMIRDGLSLIDTFYKGLLSDLPSEECPPVFETGMGFQANSAEAQKEQKDYWDYIKRNRALFLWFDRSDDFLEIYPDSEFFNKSIKVISFYNPSDPINYISGHLEITLETGLDSYDGALKQITFPIELDEEVKASRISFVNIKVNGLYLDYPEGNFARGTRPLCEKLGFSSANFQYFLRLKQLLVFQCVLIIALLGAILLLTVSIRRKHKLAVYSLDVAGAPRRQHPEGCATVLTRREARHIKRVESDPPLRGRRLTLRDHEKSDADQLPES